MTHLLNLTHSDFPKLRNNLSAVFITKNAKNIFQSIKHSNAQTVSNNDVEDSDSSNPFYSPSFAQYILDNWCGLLPLWTSLHLGDQGRHGSSTTYQSWSAKYGNKECVINPPKTEGIIEFHQKFLKHISLNSKRERLDEVVKYLFVCKQSKLR